MRQQRTAGERYQLIQMDRPRSSLVMSKLPRYVDKILECTANRYRHDHRSRATPYVRKTGRDSTRGILSYGETAIYAEENPFSRYLLPVSQKKSHPLVHKRRKGACVDRKEGMPILPRTAR